MSASTRLFGTDGIRGPAGVAPLDQPSLLRLGRTLGEHLRTTTDRPSAILAGDTRRSTPEICRWLAQGLAAAGCDSLFGGVLPTPAVSRLVKSHQATVGIAVSASHNPFPDNGVKLLDGSGFKWSRTREIELERLFETAERPVAAGDSDPLPIVGSLRDEYLAELVELFPAGALEGLSVVLDTANGAASGLATEFFEILGAAVHSFGDQPDGSNINLGCGSTQPERAVRATVEQGADLGLAFDGDADRAVAIDETGALHDGDGMMYALASWLRANGRLEPPKLVATSMSNLGLEVALEREGIGMVRCDVGDRAVVEALQAEGLEFGGEQAGHIVHLGYSSTGDGLVSAALLAHAVKSSGRTLSALTAGFRRFPQVLLNVEVPAKPELGTLPRVQAEAQRVEHQLGRHGRLVLRYSGTEPLARVMIEGPDQDEIERQAESLATLIKNEIDSLAKKG